MKCVKNILSGDIKRVKEDKVDEYLVKGWAYCPKHEWKEKGSAPIKEREKKSADQEGKKEKTSKYKNKKNKKILKSDRKKNKEINQLPND